MYLQGWVPVVNKGSTDQVMDWRSHPSCDIPWQIFSSSLCVVLGPSELFVLEREKVSVPRVDWLADKLLSCLLSEQFACVFGLPK